MEQVMGIHPCCWEEACIALTKVSLVYRIVCSNLSFIFWIIYSVVENDCVRILLYKNIWPPIAEDINPTRWSYKERSFVNLKLVIFFFFFFLLWVPQKSYYEHWNYVDCTNVSYCQNNNLISFKRVLSINRCFYVCATLWVPF